MGESSSLPPHLVSIFREILKCMFDIQFFQKSLGLKQKLLKRQFSPSDAKVIFEQLESFRSPDPSVFNIETTNNCNMTCVMCPRTKLMTRGISNLGEMEFQNLIDQITPHNAEDLESFERFIEADYAENLETPSENSFFFRLVSKCLLLHGYGEPLLDKLIVHRVTLATERGIPTYFSCVPANLTAKKGIELMEAGLTVLKVSIDALDDQNQKRIRGSRNNFTNGYETVLDILEAKKAKGLKTIIAPTMIQLSNTEEAKEQARQFIDLWAGKDVFAYVKSQDNRWYYEENSELENRSHHAKQYCEFPWISMSVSAEGLVVPCTQDYNTEIQLGDTKKSSLKDIWNGEEYKKLRMYHITGQFPAGHKCSTRCDQRKIADLLRTESDKTKGSEPSKCPEPTVSQINP